MRGLLLLLGLLASGDETRFDERRIEARTALEEGSFALAERLYRELVALYPQRVEPYRGLAEVFAARGDRKGAVDLLLEVARELVKVSREDDARAPLEDAVRLDSARAEAHALLGRVLGEERRYREAAGTLERAVELGSTGLETLLYLAASYWETERYADAEAVYRRALASHGDAFAALSHYGQFLLFQGRPAEAVGPLERAAVRRPSDAGVRVYLARALAESGEPERAAGVYRQALALEPGHEEARYGLDLLRSRNAVPPAPARREDADEGRAVLTPAAELAGLDFRHDPGTTAERHLPETMGSGLAWLDYDGDGWQDLYLVQSGPFPPDGSPAAANRLYRNRGDGTFEDVTGASGAGDRSYGQGAVAADVDGDGDTDLYVTNYGPDVYLRNRGDGTFEDASAAAGLALGGWSSSAAFADGDGDGDLDLFVTGYVDYDPGDARLCGDAATGKRDYCNVVFFSGADDAYFRQRDDGVFEEATLAAGFEHPAGRGLGVVFTDLDGDGRPDVYVANDLDPNRLYRNRGDGTFEDVSLLSGAACDREGKAQAGMGVAAGDVDGDGLPDLAVANFDTETNTLYRNLGELRFEDVSAASGFGVPSYNLLGFGLVLADLDLDGDLDAYVANGHVFERPTRDTVTRAERDLVLLGDGGGGFVEQRLADGPERIGRGAAAADYDGDGDPDVAVQTSGGRPELWRNAADGSRWSGVVLEGRGSNRQAVGARITLRTPRRGLARWVVSGESYQSSGDRRVLFGWAPDEEPRELEVRWPSASTWRLEGPPVGRYLRIRERSRQPAPTSGRR